MEFFLKIIYQWLCDKSYSFALYGADGQPITSRYAGNLPNEFIPSETNGYSYPFPYWICYPIVINGEYRGCWCFVDDDNCSAHDNFVRVVEMTEIACGLGGNS